jgi:hypothetical protein
MDPEVIRSALMGALESVASKARADALAGESDIGSVFDDEVAPLPSLDIAKIEEAMENINKATATKEGARRLINGLLLVAKVAAKAGFPA